MAYSLSLVVPCYNEHERLEKFLTDFKNYWPNTNFAQIELIFVEDGSRPESVEQTKVFISQFSEETKIHCQHLCLPINQGKGAAIKKGFEVTQSPLVGFLDADGATHPRSAYLAYKALESNPLLDAVIGSRILMLGSHVVRKSLRHYVGRIFATFVSVLFSESVYDSQCGCKFFRKSSLDSVISLPNDTRWTWDTQIVLSLLKTNRKVIECGVNWHDQSGSKVSVVKDSIRMAYHLIKFYKSRPWKNVKLAQHETPALPVKRAS